ncbi:MAG: hypothetical protein NTY01_09700 [Verrucomicrobia bacterium]|nr:hypothetical protein [Verrucomicrobiota bacterium]
MERHEKETQVGEEDRKTRARLVGNFSVQLLFFDADLDKRQKASWDCPGRQTDFSEMNGMAINGQSLDFSLSLGGGVDLETGSQNTLKDAKTGWQMRAGMGEKGCFLVGNGTFAAWPG